MLGHFIFRFGGKGWLLLITPLIAGIILFEAADVLQFSDKYILSVSLLASALFLWFFDKGPQLLTYGFKNTPKSRHTFWFIEIKYWALVMGIIGCIVLGHALVNL